MTLQIILKKAINGYWDGGTKTTFNWDIENNYLDGKSKVGSWEANYYFEVATGKTEKATLINALRSIAYKLRKQHINFKYQYIN